MNESKELKFLKSSLQKEGKIATTAQAIEWLKEQNAVVKVNVVQKDLTLLKDWIVDSVTGDIRHKSGKFFSIEGIRVQTDWGLVNNWEQPIINQPEIGFLGILTKQIDGVLHFLMQAKIEPGNINVVQLSPTLQATKSNYTRVHKGKSPNYLEYFNGEKKVEVLVDQLQSEQGARFLRKRNRNIIIEVKDTESIPVLENFIWLTLGQLKTLIKIPNLVNMDTRTVIAGIPFGSYDSSTLRFYDALQINTGAKGRYFLQSMLMKDGFYNSSDSIISWITNLKSTYELNVNTIPVNKIKDWHYSDGVIRHKEEKYFSVIGVGVEIENREVVNWDQPMVKPAQEGIIAFIVKKINGVYHFLVQAKLEAGNHDIIELAPTVQCLTGNYRSGLNDYTVPFINEVMSAKPENIWYSAYQSEEGGRFYQEQNKNMIIEATDEFSMDVPLNYNWMTLQQLMSFLKFNNYLNIASRSLISAVDF